MKTGGEKHNNWKYDLDWNCITPLSVKQVKNAKKLRIKEYKRRARRIAKKIKEFFLSGKEDVY